MHCSRWLRYRQQRRGSALIIVLWVIALLSFIIITTLMVAMQDADSAAARRAVFRARQLAEMGVAVAVNPAVKRDDAILRQKLSHDERFDAVITSEESRLNLNALMTEERRPLLQRIFIEWGMGRPDAEALVDCLMDWTDEDSFKRLKGAEKQAYDDSGYPDRPYNRPFQTFDEAALVKGMDALTELRPDWRDWFTLRGSGLLDINEASAETLSLATGVALSLATTLVRHRDGADGIPGTEDDSRYQSVEEALVLLGGGGQELASLLAVQSTTVRVESFGQAGDIVRGIAVVLRRQGGAPQVLEWREFVVDR